ncbi:hypothetical protein [Sporosarcina trichiuri]|uniref:hypothetical protein n=1 Tax=Sporosarcina trichiuri TaxID=3056445 RepID=UPI0025B3F5A0|nr:hypothetical protein [Sporosarcina sp. 0.2-SM1T-5]WJY27471.1 hypothetical protein QWT68_00170 [Sporosarcina sp. 0.2-SM1T-5]
MDVFDIVKAKLPGPLDETVLALQIAEVGEHIKNYTNQTTVPDGLKFVHANMVVDLYNADKRRADPEGQTAVSSVKEGDVTVQFGSVKVDSRERAMERMLYDYAPQLNKFRRMRW